MNIVFRPFCELFFLADVSSICHPTWHVNRVDANVPPSGGVLCCERGLEIFPAIGILVLDGIDNVASLGESLTGVGA